MESIKMADLQGQYLKIKDEMDQAVQKVMQQCDFINGGEVQLFAEELSNFLKVKHVVTCGNGTDALQLALMALELPAGSEIIVPSFCYIAAAEAAALLGFKVVFADVDASDFNLLPSALEQLITDKTKAIIAVHLFGQCANMLKILKLAQKYNLYVLEDNAQSMGAVFTWPDGTQKMAGTMGHIGTTSFFPTKNLSCMGDGGAVFTNDTDLATKIKMLANHGQTTKYIHEKVGINSRLDTLQAAVLRVKLKYLPAYNSARQQAAAAYGVLLRQTTEVAIPVQVEYSTHVFHQYVLKAENRDDLKDFLAKRNIPTMVYYPVPLHRQAAFSKTNEQNAADLKTTDQLSKNVIALPMHTELKPQHIEIVCMAIQDFYSL